MKFGNANYCMCEGRGLTNISDQNNQALKVSATAHVTLHGPGFA